MVLMQVEQTIDLILHKLRRTILMYGSIQSCWIVGQLLPRTLDQRHLQLISELIDCLAIVLISREGLVEFSDVRVRELTLLRDKIEHKVERSPLILDEEHRIPRNCPILVESLNRP